MRDLLARKITAQQFGRFTTQSFANENIWVNVLIASWVTSLRAGAAGQWVMHHATISLYQRNANSQWSRPRWVSALFVSSSYSIGFIIPLSTISIE